MSATTNGCEIVCPCGSASAASAYASPRAAAGTKRSRGTLAIAWSTRSSWMPRRSSWRAIHLGGTANRDTEVLGDGALDAGDRRGRRPEPDRQHRHLGVGGLERAVAAAAEVVAAGEVEELPARRRGDEHLAGVRVAHRGRGTCASVGHRVEKRLVLVAVPARNHAAVLLEDDDAGGGLLVESLGDRPG